MNMNYHDIRQEVIYTIDGKQFNNMEDAIQYVEMANILNEYYQQTDVRNYNECDAKAIAKFLKWYINRYNNKD